MTRPEKMSKRKAFNKAVRARAAQEQTSFASVLQRTQDIQHKRSFRATLNLPTRTARPQRQNMFQIHGNLHDASPSEEECDCGYDNDNNVEPKTKKTVVIELMAMAKPAKVKGMAKDYEFVKRVGGVIALDDSPSDLDIGEDEWEEISYEQGFRGKRTYSAALRGR